MAPKVGDSVDVPGGMHGIVKFIGEVAGKKGTFAGVQLAPEYAAKGKNSGDVEGRHYFRTSRPGSGIFLPVDKASRRPPATPTTPSLSGLNQGGPSSTLARPNFSQSVGPGARASSPAIRPRLRRPSLPRPESPLRKSVAPPKTTPKLSTPGTRASMTPASKSKFGTGSRIGTNPIVKPPNLAASLRAGSALSLRGTLGPEAAFDEESDDTPTPTPLHQKFIDHTIKDEEIKRLKDGLEQKDRQLREQGATLSDMERSLAELQSLLPDESEAPANSRNKEVQSHDVAQLRNTIREKNEKIQILATEFDAHRADFRSTIDTLEMASTETERVYEKRVDELLQEVRELQDRGEDLGNVSQQLKQLEELVQELEEGLEDARRGEAEARGEVEFLRGEVERGRSELKRERSKAVVPAVRDDGSEIGSNRSSFRELEAKDDEIRGLKTIIHSLSSSSPDGTKNGLVNGEHEIQLTQVQTRLSELENLLALKTSREAELERDLERLRNANSAAPVSPDKHQRSNLNGTHRLSDRTVVPRDWREQSGPTPALPTQLETMPETDAQSTVTDGSSALWCEICETGGHDILTCTNVFAGGARPQGPTKNGLNDPDRVAPLRKKSSHANFPGTSQPQPPPTEPAPHPPTSSNPPSAMQTPRLSAAPDHTTKHTHMELGSPPPPPPSSLSSQLPLEPTMPSSKQPNPLDQGMVAGKSSGVIDGTKWCALCERDGHESVDCPFEDAF